MKKYNLKEEYKVNIENPKIKREIANAVGCYQTFMKKFIQRLDLKNTKSIDEAYSVARKMGIFKKAREIRELVFGKNIYFYGVVYLWDACVNWCAYCPGSVPNRKKVIMAGREYQLRELTKEDAVRETLAVMGDGHVHLCYLTGSTPSIEKYPDKIIPYLNRIIEATKSMGLREIILNVEPMTERGFKKIVQAVTDANKKNKTWVSLQFRVFQETYNQKTYAKMHPKGPKSDYRFRKESQARAIKSGFDNVGLGVLFGLYRFPLEEIESLKNHASELEEKYGKRPARVCLPSANELENVGVKIPSFLKKGRYDADGKKLLKLGDYEKFNELIYALTRLAMPTLNLVSSERDRPAMLRILDDYATCTTLNVHPGVGENTDLFLCANKKSIHFEQATVFPRNPKETIESLKQRGFNPVINRISST